MIPLENQAGKISRRDLLKSAAGMAVLKATEPLMNLIPIVDKIVPRFISLTTTNEGQRLFVVQGTGISEYPIGVTLVNPRLAEIKVNLCNPDELKVQDQKKLPFSELQSLIIAPYNPNVIIAAGYKGYPPVEICFSDDGFRSNTKLSAPENEFVTQHDLAEIMASLSGFPCAELPDSHSVTLSGNHKLIIPEENPKAVLFHFAGNEEAFDLGYEGFSDTNKLAPLDSVTLFAPTPEYIWAVGANDLGVAYRQVVVDRSFAVDSSWHKYPV